jgi:hypothetical protein
MNWLDLERCQWFDHNCEPDCKGKITHVTFLNTPDIEPYIVGTCRRHRDIEPEFPHITLKKLMKAMDKLKAEGVSDKDMPYAIAKTIDLRLMHG